MNVTNMDVDGQIRATITGATRQIASYREMGSINCERHNEASISELWEYAI